MSTRGIYQFTQGNDSVCVYKHMDNYPEGEHGGFAAIAKAAALAWPLPRFEADEFAAAFVAANKTSGGNVRLTNDRDWYNAASDDCEYAYIVNCKGDALRNAKVTVTCLAIAPSGAPVERGNPRGNWRIATLHTADLADIIAGWRPVHAPEPALF